MKVAVFGYGAIGTEIVRCLLARPHQVVAVFDVDPAKAGRTLAELSGLPSGVRVQVPSADAGLAGAEVAIFSTTSRLRDLAPGVIAALEAGVDVVTTSEEMAYAEYSDPNVAGEIDRVALARGVTAVGVGVNPGFVMDWVPAVVASASSNPSSIHVVRSVDVGRRRRQLQSKVGVGLGRARFEKELAEGRLGHVGLIESAHLIARSLGRPLTEVTHGVFPVPGAGDHVTGVRQFVEGTAGGCRIRLDLEMSLTSADFDVVEVKGDPDVKLRFEKGVFGDSATVALVVNAAERVANARPGLITVLDLPLSK